MSAQLDLRFSYADFTQALLRQATDRKALAPGRVKNEQGFLALEKALGNPNSDVRAAMAWALGCIGSSRAKTSLYKANDQEEHDSVRRIIE